MKNILNRIKTFIKPAKKKNWEDASLILAANSIINSHLWRETPDFSQPKWIQDKEFSVYSQFGDDGIIQWLIYFLKLPKKFGSFIEFGVGDFFESNTHFLQINNRWRGFVMDGDKNHTLSPHVQLQRLVRTSLRVLLLCLHSEQHSARLSGYLEFPLRLVFLLRRQNGSLEYAENWKIRCFSI